MDEGLVVGPELLHVQRVCLVLGVQVELCACVCIRRREMSAHDQRLLHPASQPAKPSSNAYADARCTDLVELLDRLQELLVPWGHEAPVLALVVPRVSGVVADLLQ